MENNNTVVFDSDDANIKCLNEANPRDIEFFFFTKSKLMKIYIMYKNNKELFKNYNCCDRCYGVYPSKNEYFRCLHNGGFNLCDECFNGLEDKYKCNYKHIVPVANKDTGLYEINY